MLPLAGRDPGRFVHLQPDAVTGAVGEVVAKPSGHDHVPSDLVGLLTGHARLQRRFGGGLGLEDDAIDLFEPVWRWTEADGPGHVGAVAVPERPDVDRDRL